MCVSSTQWNLGEGGEGGERGKENGGRVGGCAARKGNVCGVQDVARATSDLYMYTPPHLRFSKMRSAGDTGEVTASTCLFRNFFSSSMQQ